MFFYCLIYFYFYFFYEIIQLVLIVPECSKLNATNSLFCRELDVLSRQHTCFNLVSCATTLGSLSRLVSSHSIHVLVGFKHLLLISLFWSVLLLSVTIPCAGSIPSKDDYHGWNRKTGQSWNKNFLICHLYISLNLWLSNFYCGSLASDPPGERCLLTVYFICSCKNCSALFIPKRLGLARDSNFSEDPSIR